MASPSSSAEDAIHNARAKELGRGSRMSFRKIGEHQLRQELKEEALEICDPEVKAFAKCSSEKGLLVIFSCRDLFHKVNQCLSLNAGEEAWQKYKAEHEDEIDFRVAGKSGRRENHRQIG